MSPAPIPTSVGVQGLAIVARGRTFASLPRSVIGRPVRSITVIVTIHPVQRWCPFDPIALAAVSLPPHSFSARQGRKDPRLPHSRASASELPGEPRLFHRRCGRQGTYCFSRAVL